MFLPDADDQCQMKQLPEGNILPIAEINLKCRKWWPRFPTKDHFQGSSTKCSPRFDVIFMGSLTWVPNYCIILPPESIVLSRHVCGGSRHKPAMHFKPCFGMYILVKGSLLISFSSNAKQIPSREANTRRMTVAMSPRQHAAYEEPQGYAQPAQVLQFYKN